MSLRTFCALERHKHIRVSVDNTTTVAYVNKQGGRKRALNEVARRIWLWAMERQLWLSAVHLPGVLNVAADRASRADYAQDTEWQLNKNIFNRLNRLQGPFEIDLFATRINTQCEKFFAWNPDPDALAIDALLQSWDFNSMYAFPPFSLIGRLLQRVEQTEGTVHAVLPLWPTQPWFGRALRLSTAHPHILPRQSTIVQLPQDPSRTHPLVHRLNLTVFSLSGNPSRQEAFQTRLPLSSTMPGGDPRNNNIGRISTAGANFVLYDRWLQVKPLPN